MTICAKFFRHVIVVSQRLTPKHRSGLGDRWMDGWIDGYIHPYIHACMHPYIHPYIHTQTDL
jgi:hypothetical protein